MIRFAHLQSGLLQASAKKAGEALPLYPPTVRARIAVRLRSAVQAGHLSPSAVTAAVANPAGVDQRLAALGTRMQKKFRAMAKIRPAIPSGLTTPYDPFYESAGMRRALKCWGSTLLCMDAITPDAVSSALSEGGRALAGCISQACASYADQCVSDLFKACGFQTTAQVEPLWVARPAWMALDNTETPIESVLLFPADNTFTVTGTTHSVDDAGAMLLFSALMSFRLRALSLVCPQDIGTEGFVGSMLFSDLESYVGEAVQSDGSVILSDDLLEHLENEHGIEREDEDGLDRVRKSLTFLARKKGLIPHFKSPYSAVMALRSFASTLDNEDAATALRGIASLLHLQSKADKSFHDTEVSAESLEEESWAVGVHIVSADLTGFEGSLIDDLHDGNMNCGSDGALFVQASSAESAYRLAVREASVITVLSTLIESYAEATLS